MRAKLALDGLLLPDSFGSGQWYPVWMQIVLTQTIRKVFFECDTPGFCEMLIHAGRTSASPWMTTMLRFVGPAAVLRRADLLHPHFYDVGAISSVVTGRAAELMCKDAVLFENPTWRALQLAGQQGLIELTGSKLVSAVGMDAGAGAFRMKVSWT
ncbi:MAG: hypothetical protein HUU55_05915 [Myxococcales bacterium]|nr:hypothetical protein [Myxococcales bacterium]